MDQFNNKPPSPILFPSYVLIWFSMVHHYLCQSQFYYITYTSKDTLMCVISCFFFLKMHWNFKKLSNSFWRIFVWTTWSHKLLINPKNIHYKMTVWSHRLWINPTNNVTCRISCKDPQSSIFLIFVICIFDWPITKIK